MSVALIRKIVLSPGCNWELLNVSHSKRFGAVIFPNLQVILLGRQDANLCWTVLAWRRGGLLCWSTQLPLSSSRVYGRKVDRKGRWSLFNWKCLLLSWVLLCPQLVVLALCPAGIPMLAVSQGSAVGRFCGAGQDGGSPGIF